MDIDDKNSPLRQRIVRQRATPYNMLIDPMSRVARRCAKVWGEKPALDHLLRESIPRSLTSPSFMPWTATVARWAPMPPRMG